jgi:DNA-binding CsgD family transcriptional regulator/tetratricopeptide (TPR) repeat protein
VLRERLAAALAGHGSLVLIGGEAGIGKTALAAALCREAADRGTLVLVGHGYDLSETPPYGPWAEALARAPAGDPLPVLPTAVLSPERDGAALTGQDAILRRVRDYLAALAALQPVVLLLDDLHWADPASLDLLRVIGRGLADLPLLLLATYRAEEVGREHPLAALLPLLVREAHVVRLELRPLDAAAMGTLVAARYALADADRDRLVQYLVGRTEGNALFLSELLRTLEAEDVLHATGERWSLGNLAGVPVPTLLRQVIEGRLRRMAPETERLLAVAAVIGQEVPVSLWAAVAGTDEEGVLEAVEAAAGVRLVVDTPDGTGMRFAHALIREALYAGLPRAQRRGWHRRTGEALLETPQPDPDAVAHHFGRAGDPRAFAWLVRAGLRAWRAAAWLTAASRFAAAAALPDEDGTHTRMRGWLHFCRGRLLIFADNAQALHALEAAEPLAVAVGDAALAAYIRIHRGQLHNFGGELRRGMAELERGVEELDALPDAYRLREGLEAALATLAALLPDGERAAPVAPPAPSIPPITPYRVNLVNMHGHIGRYREAITMGEAYIAAFAAPGDDGLIWGAFAQLGLGHAHAALGRPEAARRAYALSRAGHYLANNAHTVGFSIWCELLLAVLPYQADDLPERARLVAEAARAWERARGTITATAFDTPIDLFPALVEGRWADADRLAQGSLTAAVGGISQGAIVALGMLARHRGEPDRAWERVRALHPAGPETEPGDCYFAHGIALQALAADLALDAGELATAARWIAAHERWLDWSDAVLWRADHLLLHARHALVAGERECAREYAEAALRQAGAPRQPLRLLAAQRLLGELATDAGRYDDAAAHLATALALTDACAAPYERALSLLVRAQGCAATGDTAAARAALDEARSICIPLDAKPALARAEAIATLLAAKDATSRNPAGLSAREVEVLRFVARGDSNRTIAATLSVSVWTVKQHVAHILDKTGAENRAAATAFAIRHNLA